MSVGHAAINPLHSFPEGQDLAFLVSNKTAFELPLAHVANSNIAGRTEVSLEFAPRSAKPPRNGPDELAEIRFYVPGTHTKGRGSDAGSDKSDNEDDGEEISAAQAFHDLVKEKAELGQVSGDIILSFDEVNVLTPRGRYDVDMYPEFLRLRGRTYDYKIMYGSISKLFLLPKDDLHVLFIVSAIRTCLRYKGSDDCSCSLGSAFPSAKVRHGISTLSCNSTARRRSLLS